MPDLNSSQASDGESQYSRVGFIGGIYSNYLALEAAIAKLNTLGVDAIHALGDFGAFGPHPNRTLDLLRKHDIPCIQGNYEESLSSGAEDCHCGYTDPRDNHFARLSYDYTNAHTSADHKRWMATLPLSRRIRIGSHRVLLSHGSPRRINEFLWQSATPSPFIHKLLRDFDTDAIVCTHTGLHWHRFVEPGKGLINVGSLGRPANDGTTRVWTAIVEAAGSDLKVEHVPIEYDFERLAREMASEGLPPEFIETITTGWWTSCLEILPAKERALGRY